MSRKRWLVAHERETVGIENTEDVREWLRVRRHTWANLVDLLKDTMAFDSSKRILDIGGGPTSIFLALREGERYAVDPVYEHLFQLHPFMGEVEEYEGVNFIASPIEEVAFDKQFNLIFTINAIDHVGELQPVIKKIDELLAPSGILVVIVDCYADSAVRNIINFFDADIPHPHHFITEDIIRLFPDYKLKKQDNKIFELINEPAFRGRSSAIEIYRIDKFIARMRHNLKIWGKKGDTLFALKFFLCYGLALLIASIRKRERQIHPLKKLRLFIFQR
ncbi:class I SAM-dependent methyltransferase [Chloroflexota bacterium]